MGKRTSYEPGTFSWVELSTSDPEAAKNFYSGVFGWDYEDNEIPGGGTYTMVQHAGGQVAGLMTQPEPQRSAGAPPNWLSYVAVADAGETASRADELGGQVHAGPFEVGHAGRMAVVADPSGAMFGVWQARDNIGATVVNEPGCLTWNELSTSDLAAATTFYEGLFGWKVEPLDTGDAPPYSSIAHEGGAGGRNGGMRELSQPELDAGVPPNWMPYFTVEFTDGTIETANGLGGSVLAGPMDLSAGRIAVFKDPQGAVFGVFEGEVDD